MLQKESISQRGRMSGEIDDRGKLSWIYLWNEWFNLDLELFFNILHTWWPKCHWIRSGIGKWLSSMDWMHSIMQVVLTRTENDWAHRWICSSYNRLLSVKEEIEQKYLHLSQVYESEAKTKYQYLQQVEELSTEVRELRREVNSELRKFKHLSFMSFFSYHDIADNIIYYERKALLRKTLPKFEKSKKFKVCAEVGYTDNAGNALSKNISGKRFSFLPTDVIPSFLHHFHSVPLITFVHVERKKKTFHCMVIKCSKDLYRVLNLSIKLIFYAIIYFVFINSSSSIFSGSTVFWRQCSFSDEDEKNN